MRTLLQPRDLGALTGIPAVMLFGRPPGNFVFRISHAQWSVATPRLPDEYDSRYLSQNVRVPPKAYINQDDIDLRNRRKLAWVS